MARKSRAAKLTRKVANRKRKRKNAALIQNPAVGQDLAEQVIPGLVTYAGLRVGGRIAYKLGKRKGAGWAKHLGALTPVLLAAGGYYAVHKSEKLKPYHDAFVVAAAIAVIQSLMQTYAPRWGWILNDYHLDDVLPQMQSTTTPAGAPKKAANGSKDPHAPYDDLEGDDDLDVDDDFSDIPGLGSDGGFNVGIFAN